MWLWCVIESVCIVFCSSVSILEAPESLWQKERLVTSSRRDFCFSLAGHWKTLVFVRAMQSGWRESHLQEGTVLNTSDTFIKRMPSLFGFSDYLFIDFHQSPSSFFTSQICHLIFPPLTSLHFSSAVAEMLLVINQALMFLLKKRNLAPWLRYSIMWKQSKCEWRHSSFNATFCAACIYSMWFL